MLIVLKKTYTISLTIQEGNDEFWDGLKGKSGCDEVVEMVRDAMNGIGLPEPECYVQLEKFEKRG